MPVVTRPGGAPPRLLELQTRAVVLEGNEALGDPWYIRSIFRERSQWRKAWMEVLALLDATRAASPDGHQAFDRAVDALKSHDSERNFVGEVSRRLLRKLLTAANSDRAQALEILVQGAQRDAEAAERFATRPRDKRPVRP